MNEESELWAAYKAQQKEDRERGRAEGPEALRSMGVAFTTHNNGAHLVIKTGTSAIDYWPGTTRWAVRGQRSRHGLPALLKLLHQWKDAGVLNSKPGVLASTGTLAADFEAKRARHQEDEAFVERMTRAFPHLGEEV